MASVIRTSFSGASSSQLCSIWCIICIACLRTCTSVTVRFNEIMKDDHAEVIWVAGSFKVIVGTSLINLYGKHGMLGDTHWPFDRIMRRNVVTWTAIITCYVYNGNEEASFKLFRQMQFEDVEPHNFTFASLLSGCLNPSEQAEGLLSEGGWYFVSIHQAYGITPCLEHFGCMADHLGRAALLSEAEELIYDMPWQSSPMMWVTLLDACRLRRDLEQGKRIAQNLIDLGSKDAVTYILLRHIHAAASGWHHENLDKAVEEEKTVECSLSIERESEEVQLLIDINYLLHGFVRKDVIYYNE